jgi:hypothetical protein
MPSNPTVQLNVPIVAIDNFSKSLKEAQVGLEGFYRLGKGDIANLTEQLQVMAKVVTSLAQAFSGAGGLIQGLTVFGAAAAIATATMTGVTVAVSGWARNAAGLERLSTATGIAYGRLKAFQEASSAAEFQPGLQALELAVGHLQKLKLQNIEERRALVQLIPEDYGAIQKLAAAGKFTEAIEYIIRLSERLDPQTVGLLTQHFFGTADTQLVRDVWELSKQYEKQFEVTKQQKATIMEIEKTLAQIVIEWKVLLDMLAKWVAPEVLTLLKRVKELIESVTNPPGDPAERERILQEQIRYWSGIAGIPVYGTLWAGAAGLDALLGTNMRGAVYGGFVDYMQWLINNVYMGRGFKTGFGFMGSAKAGEMPGGAFGADGGGAGMGSTSYGRGGPTFRPGIGPGSSGHVGADEAVAPAPGGLDYDASDTGYVGVGQYNFMGSKLAAELGMGDVGPGHPELRRFKTGIPESVARGISVITANKYAGADIAGFLHDLYVAGAPLGNFAGVYVNKPLQHGMGNAVDIETGFGSGPNNSAALYAWAQAHPKEFAYIQAKHHMRNLDTSSGARMHDWGHFEWSPTGRAPKSQPAPVKSSSLAPLSGDTKLAINLNVVGPAGTRATARMKSDDDLFDADTIRRAVLA